MAILRDLSGIHYLMILFGIGLRSCSGSSEPWDYTGHSHYTFGDCGMTWR